MNTFANPTRRALALVGFVALTTVSCGDDGPGPLGGERPAPSYRATLESFGGSLNIVCGSASNDVYAIGSVILHFDGSRWDAVELPERRAYRFQAAWGGTGGLFLADSDGDVFRRTTDHWFWDAHLDRINDMWASGPSDVYAVGYESVFHFDGGGWSEVGLPEHEGLYAVSGSAADDVVIVGYRGRVLHYNGENWTSALLDSFASYYAVARSASGRTFVADWGRIWEIVGSVPEMILDNELDDPALCVDGDALYAVGRTWSSDDFSVRRYDGGDWSVVYSGTGAVRDMWRAPDGVLFVAGADGLLWRSDGQAGETMTPYPKRQWILDAWSIDGTVFLAGVGAYRVEDGRWTDLGKEYVTTEPARSLFGRSRDDIYAVGDRMILHFDGAQWTWVNGGLGVDFGSVWMDADRDVLAVGRDDDTYEGVLVEYDGTEWKRVPIPTKGERLGGVWGSARRAFVVGANGLIVVRDHGNWHVMTPPTSADLVDVWGLDDGHVYAISSDPSEICFFDGRTWEAMEINEVYVAPMTSIWGTSPGDLFVVDDHGTIAHFDGRAWSPLPRIFSEGVQAVCGLPGRDVLVAGYDGTAIYRRE